MLPRPDFDRLRTLAQRGGLTLTDAEESSALKLSEHLLGMVDGLDCDHSAVASAPLAGPRLEAQPDPCHAVARWVDIPPSHPGMLDGLRVTVKDSMSVAGVELRAGSEALRGFVPDRHSVVVDRLSAAGGRVVAVTTMDDLAYSGGGDTSIDGPTFNPFDRTRSAGGSSSGAAASLWYSGIDAALGTDQGGSIRLPASWCGVLGLKPTFGLVPYTGIVGMDPTVDHVGPMALDVETLARVLTAIHGPDDQDSRALSSPKRDFTKLEAKPLSAWSIAVPSSTWGSASQADPAVSDAFAHLLERFAAAGVSIRHIDLPLHDACGGIAFATYMEATAAMHASGGNALHRTAGYWPELAIALGEGTRRADTSLSLHYRIQVALGHHLQETRHGSLYARAQQQRHTLRQQYDEALTRADLLVMPTSPRLPHKAEVPVDGSEHVRRGWDNLANTTPTNLTGHPAISMPLANAGHLPVGVMAVAPHLADNRLLNFAAACESELGWTAAPSL